MIELAIILLVLCRHGSFVFTKEHTIVLKCILPILVIASHYLPVRYGFPENIKFLGAFSVSIFFFISGFGLTEKLNNSSDIKVKYYTRKVVALLIPLFTASTLYVLLYYLIYGTIQPLQILGSLQRGEFVIPLSWFVLKLIILYLAFFVSSLFARSEIILCFLVLSVMVFERYFNIERTYYMSDLAFIAGVVYNRINIGRMNVNIRRFLYVLMICITLFHPAGLVYILSFATPILFVSLFSSIDIFRTSKKPLCTFLSRISYETYLVQCIPALVIYRYCEHNYISFFIILFFSLLISYCMHYVNSLIIRGLFKQEVFINKGN